ncbi:MAG TPA: anthranilate synthase component I [Candidatus Bathyarchaeia archaeon]
MQNLRSPKKWGIVFGQQTAPTATSCSGKITLKFKKIPFEVPPLQIFSRLHEKYENAYLLESIEGPRKLAQYSFIGFAPSLKIITKNGTTSIRDERSGKERCEKTSDPLINIQNLISKKAVHDTQFRFTGGAVGYFSYDAVRYWEKIPVNAEDDLNYPDAEFGFFNDGIIFDHRKTNAFYYYSEKDRFADIEKTINKPANDSCLTYRQSGLNVTKERFEKAIEKAKEFVKKGDIFQTVLSKRFALKFQGDLIGFYRSLRQINPSPYMYFLKMGERQIVGASPEMLVRVDNRVVETFPIAGTRPCTRKPLEDRRLASELLADPKERAEHVMLVDLARNDLGRISEYRSVRVTEFMKVQKYSHVQHIVSRVEGILRKGYEANEVLRAMFPAGTVSGAPKVRAMEIIEELEPNRRGPYAGAVGYFGYNGNADFAITIRTLFADKDRAYIQAGAGIVADSVPEKEWDETENKAEALIKALQKCGGE